MDRPQPDHHAGELVTLTQFLDYLRATMLLKADGLSAEQLRQPLPTSPLTLAGLLKHLALVEDSWFQICFAGRPEAELEPWGSVDWTADGDWDFHSAANDDPDYLRQLYRSACQRSRDIVAATDDLDRLSVNKRRDGDHRNLRWILVHLIEETSRHCGHADLLREAIDGQTGE